MSTYLLTGKSTFVMKDSHEIIDNISMLYELSLSIGHTLDLRENAANFIESLLYKMNFSYAAVWLNQELLEEEGGSFFSLCYAYPTSLAVLPQLSKKQGFLDGFDEQPILFFKKNQEEDILPLLLRPDEQLCIFYNMGNLGFLELHCFSLESYKNPLKLYSLHHVVHKFAKSLEAGIAYKQSMIESNKRSRIEAQLLASEGKYRSVVRNIREGLVITDLEGTITFVNDRFIEMLGFGAEEIIGQKGYEILVPNHLWGEYKERLEKRKRGLDETYEMPLVGSDGALHWVSIRATPYKDSSGEIRGTLAAVIDISRRKIVEQKILESQTKLQLILDTSLDAIVIIDEKGMVTDWNHNAESIFGFLRQEAIGKSLSELILPHEMRELHEKGMRHFLKTGEGPVLNKRIELNAIHNNGITFPVELSISPMKIDGVFYFSAYIRDITIRKQNENALIEAKKAAEEARKAERQFLAHMSHEIRTPMNAVIGMTHLLKKTASEEQEDYLEALQFSADSLMNIISDILDLSKIEAGEISLDKRSFSLQKLIYKLQKSFQLKVQERNISVNTNVSTDITHQVIGDQTRLNQILSNLLGNATKFTNEGHMGLNVQLQRETDEIYLVEFEVYDSGIGISADQINKIFERFKQANETIHSEFGGTGLGLSIVKQLVELQEGSIEISSELGKGTNFKIVIPYQKSDAIAIVEEEYSDESQEASRFLKQLNILVAEDNPINQKLMESLLGEWGVSFELAPNGLDAFQLCQEKIFDLILMDVNMPKLDGLETTKAIRSRSKLNRKTPIIALTAAALREGQIRMREAGANDFVAKPFSPKQLQKSILASLHFQAVPNILSEKKDIEEEEFGYDNFDLEYLKNFSHNNDDFVLEMIQMFLDHCPGNLKNLDQYLFEKNWKSLSDMAHQLKSTYGAMGMFKLQQSSEQIEHHAKSELVEEFKLTNWIEQLKEASESIFPKMQEIVDRGVLD